MRFVGPLRRGRLEMARQKRIIELRALCAKLAGAKARVYAAVLSLRLTALLAPYVRHPCNLANDSCARVKVAVSDAMKLSRQPCRTLLTSETGLPNDN